MCGTVTACNSCAPTKMQVQKCVCLPTLPIIPIPQSSKSSYPVSSCSACSALTHSSHLPPPPANLLPFTKICCNLPLAPDLWLDPKASRSFGTYSCQLGFPPIFFMRAGFLGILDWAYLFFQLRWWVPDTFYLQGRADFAAPHQRRCSAPLRSKFTGELWAVGSY